MSARTAFCTAGSAAVLCLVVIGHVLAQTAIPRPGYDPLSSTIWRVPDEGWGKPAADATTAYFLTQRHEMVAIDIATGQVRWKRATGRIGGSTEGSVVTLAGSVAMAGDYEVIGFDRITGNVRWRFAPFVGYAPGVSLGNSVANTVFAGSVGYLHAIDVDTGRSRWSVQVAATNPLVLAPLATG